MRLVRLLTSAVVMAAMLCVGPSMDGSTLSFGGHSAYAKRHKRKRHHKKHARRRHRKHARSASGTPEL